MRVNKIDNTNFMALKIHPKAVTKLKEEPVQTIKRLAELKEKVKDVDLYHIYFNERLIPSIRSVSTLDVSNYYYNLCIDYYYNLRNEERAIGKYCKHSTHDEVVHSWGKYEYPSLFEVVYGKEKALEEYERFKELDIYNQLAQYSKMLEEFELEHFKHFKSKYYKWFKALKKSKDLDNPTVQYIRMLIECELKKAENTNTQKATEEKIAEKIQERKDELIDSLIKECSYDESALPSAMTGPGFYTRFGADYSTRLYWHNL